ncbi:hypothetical protein CMV_010373 [Castanea mollissima]|uniref:Uncharacterized protein n=1 Tax=Castanea mollissima TaxID=60419 RepID=A0A8J4RIE8_9ROSI|nr:hypothetical protein CMV_010373 [Castanea mollissima]
MEIELLRLILSVLLGGYVFVFGFLRRFNEWYYVRRLGKTQYPLPPGDMGWPYLGGLPTFLKAFKSDDPDSYIYNLVSKYGRTGVYKTYMFGKPSVIVCTPETCRKVLTNDDQFKLGYPKATTILTDLNAGIKSQAINLPGFVFHRALKARKKLVKIFQSVLDKKRATMKDNTNQTDAKKDMMDLLMGVKDEDGRQLEDLDIIDLLIVFMLAGHESSAHGALWSVIYLSENPEVFKKAKEEQEEIMKGRPSTQKGLNLKEIRQMEYLSKVIDEMLRRTSISFSVFREAKEDVNINGYLVPKGWKVLVWNRGVHMDPETYANPKEFDPSRWDNHKPRAGSFLPFGAGSRICPGSDLAKLEIAIFLHHYILNYNVERLNPGCPVKYLPVARPTDMCLAKIIKVT